MALLKTLGNYPGNLIFGKNRNPADAAMPYLNQIPDVGHQYYDPYVNQGLQASQGAGEQYNQMSSDPMAYLNQILSGYKPSEGYQFREKRALNAAGNSAASAGLAGTENDQINRAGLVNSLMGDDMQQFLQNVLGIQQTGLTGQERQSDRGFLASSSLADLLGGNLDTQGGYAYQGARQQGANDANRRNQFFNLITGLFGGRSGGRFGG